jgi:xanthine dehydrogenase small subunit
MMRDSLLIFLNGRPVRLEGADAFLSLSDFLRRRRQLTGTKVVCAEGDCGACAVLIGRPEPTGRRLHYAAVNSCIQFMFQLDATHIVSVEGLSDGTELNPIQKSMVECHGTQCGFCTPGFVVSLYDFVQGKTSVDAHSVRRALVGNLCRCTGYDSIVRAAMEADRSKLKTIDVLYPPAPILAALAPAASESVRIQAGEQLLYKPVTIEQAVQFRAENPKCHIICGATDAGVQRNKGIRKLTTVLAINGIRSLGNVTRDNDSLIVGATATLSELERAAADHLRELADFLQWFGSPLIRNSGTLAGNLVNGSPIGDLICALFVLDTIVELTGPNGTREVPLETFYTGYRKTVLAENEIVTSIRIGLPEPGETYKLYKISRRKDLDISSFAAAIWMRTNGRRIADVRIAYGGVGPTIMRMKSAESLLRGAELSRHLFEQAAAAARDEVKPISDVRGSADYRHQLAHNILLKFWNDLDESEPESVPAGPAFREPALQRSPEKTP